MKCQKYSNLIDDLVEGELDEQNARTVNLHLFSCRECASRFEILQREKAMYAHYLFEVEPSIDLSVRFQQKLETEAPENLLTTRPSLREFEGITRILGFLRLNLAFTAAGLVILIAFVLALLNLINPGSSQSINLAYQKNDHKIQLALPIMLPKETPPLPEKNKIVTDKDDPEVTKKDLTGESRLTPIGVKQVVKPTIRSPKVTPETIQLNEDEKLQIKEIQALEIQTVKQMEKVELLLRTFRNIRYTEGSDQYDISYEKQQARKLLQNNVELRQKAESFGTIFSEEMLSKVEPYLLDIANLEINPTSEKVSEIKERVRNQNIIASLQSF